MTDPILSLDKAELTLDGAAGPVAILKGITLDIARGETVGLVGPSGSGKSSLLMLMGGLERATGGRVAALGRDLTALGEDDLARFRRDHMGVVFQSFHLIPTMTALENVATPLELAGNRDAHARAEAELAAMGLADRAGHYPAQLSGGEQQRVALARAFAPRPDILLADEPTGNLDEATGDTIMDLLFGLRDRYGSTLVLVTHARELARRCDRVVRLRDGTIETAAARAAESSRTLRVAGRIAAARAGGRPRRLPRVPGLPGAGRGGHRCGRHRAREHRGGLQREGAVILGGDAEIEVTYRFASDDERAWMERQGAGFRDRRLPLDGGGGRGTGADAGQGRGRGLPACRSRSALILPIPLAQALEGAAGRPAR